MTIASDSVDKELIMKPRRWDIGFIRKFMLTFGLISSLFDYLTFGVLIYLVKASQIQFQTGWFIESVVSACIIVLDIRTRKTFYKSVPGKKLVFATFFIVGITMLLPYTPLASLLGFQPLPAWVLVILVGIVAAYIGTAEIVKKVFYKIVKY